MALTYSWPGPTGLATTTDGRKDFAGLVETDTAGAARSGIFPAHANALVSARTDMNLDVAVFQACGVQFGGPVFFANDGVAQLGAVLVSPASGNNFYVVYAKQNESTAPGTDANNNRVLSATLSTASFAAARALLPTGAVELATALMPTGKTATNQSGVTITQTFQYTAAEGGTVWVRNSTEAAAWLPADGAQAWQMDVAVMLRRVGGAWKLWDSDWISYTPTWANHTAGNSVTTAVYRYVAGSVEFELRRTAGTTGVLTSTSTFTLPVTAHASVGTSDAIGDGSILIGSAVYPLTILAPSSTTAVLRARNTASTYESLDAVTNSIPASLVTGSEVYVAKGKYRI